MRQHAPASGHECVSHNRQPRATPSSCCSGAIWAYGISPPLNQDSQHYGCRDQKLFVLDTATNKIVTKAVMEFRKRVTASAWAPPKGNVYEFATATDSEVTLWNLDPYTGMLSQRKVVTGMGVRCLLCCVCLYTVPTVCVLTPYQPLTYKTFMDASCPGMDGSCSGPFQPGTAGCAHIIT